MFPTQNLHDEAIFYRTSHAWYVVNLISKEWTDAQLRSAHARTHERTNALGLGLARAQSACDYVACMGLGLCPYRARRNPRVRAASRSYTRQVTTLKSPRWARQL